MDEASTEKLVVKPDELMSSAVDLPRELPLGQLIHFLEVPSSLLSEMTCL